MFDVRGAMIGAPNAGEFYPALPTGATIPGRGFGFDVGGHVIWLPLGPSRVGVGASAMAVRGKVGPPDVTTNVMAVAPQISFNFGTADGWSYIGAGYGIGKISTRVTGVAETTDGGETAATGESTVETGQVGTLNFGGGARWFVNRHAAVGFDVRFYRFSASAESKTPATMRVALSVGVSLR